MSLNQKRISIVFLGLVFVIAILWFYLFKGSYKEGPVIHNSITVFNHDQTLSRTYVPKSGSSMTDIPFAINRKSIKAIASDGGIYQVHSEDEWLWDKKTGWTIRGESPKITGVVGLFDAGEGQSITDVYRDVVDDLDQDKRVLVILLDGLSYNQYREVQRREMLPFLASYFKNSAVSVYTPVTNAGFAAMITGETPLINGVHNRSHRSLAVESLFGYAIKHNKKGVLLEGHIKILDTEVEPKLHIDQNGDGDTDDELFVTTKAILKEDYDLVFVHFHGIDDRGHLYGPLADETLAYIEKLDGYIEEMQAHWDGDIIVTADHGMHETEEGGSHGLAIQEDMIVPYFSIQADPN